MMMAEGGQDVDSDTDERPELLSRSVQDDHPDRWGSVPAGHSDSGDREGVHERRPTHSMRGDEERGAGVMNTEQDSGERKTNTSIRNKMPYHCVLWLLQLIYHYRSRRACLFLWSNKRLLFYDLRLRSHY